MNTPGEGVRGRGLRSRSPALELGPGADPNGRRRTGLFTAPAAAAARNVPRLPENTAASRRRRPGTLASRRADKPFRPTAPLAPLVPLAATEEPADYSVKGTKKRKRALFFILILILFDRGQASFPPHFLYVFPKFWQKSLIPKVCVCEDKLVNKQLI